VSVATPPGTSAPSSGARRQGARLTPVGAALVFVIVVLLFALAVPVRTLMQQRADLARIQRDEHTLEQRNHVLQQQIARLNDPVHLERLARECLGMVRPGEIPFVLVGDDGRAASPDGSQGGGLDSPRVGTGC
jgi:cell division protein FtsB